MVPAQKETELEIAWLVKNLPNELSTLTQIEINQAYLENTNPQSIKDIRIREKNGEYTKTTKYFLSGASEIGHVEEETIKLTQEEYTKLWGSATKKVRKYRYTYVLSNGLIAEIDCYRDKLEGLEVVEVEFPNFAMYRKFKKPAWFGKEVTDSKRIYPPVIAEMSLTEIQKLNAAYVQKAHKFNENMI